MRISCEVFSSHGEMAVMVNGDDFAHINPVWNTEEGETRETNEVLYQELLDRVNTAIELWEKERGG